MSFLRAIAWLRANPVFLLVLALVVAYVSGRHSGVSAERARWENVIADKNREIEAHMRMAEQCAGMCQFHRETARHLAKQVAELVMGRSAETVARMERELGLS